MIYVGTNTASPTCAAPAREASTSDSLPSSADAGRAPSANAAPRAAAGSDPPACRTPHRRCSRADAAWGACK